MGDSSGVPELDGETIGVQKALQVLGETLNKKSAHMAAGSMGWLFLKTLSQKQR